MKRAYRVPMSESGQNLKTACDVMLAMGTAPKYRESREFVRLSPITHTQPSGTV